mmetsp:Transcript_105211/g.304323  ORF Transcript_105211/g.304323 Transcript_105211/m.304323 type:complete len:275 (-) Transcript_105211:4746-5570(-)
MGMSLSIVFGTPTTEQLWSTSSVLLKISMAQRWVPSPPMTKNWVTFCSFKTFAMSIGAGFPRSLTKIVPPRLWTSFTTSGVNFIHFSGFVIPWYPPLHPRMFGTPYTDKVMTISRMTEFRPGHKPPQVTITAVLDAGSKWSFDRGPPNNIWWYTCPRSSRLFNRMKVLFAQESGLKKLLSRNGPSLSKQGFATSADGKRPRKDTTSSLLMLSPGSNNEFTDPGDDRHSILRAGFCGTCRHKSRGAKSGCCVVSNMRRNHRPPISTRRPPWFVIA